MALATLLQAYCHVSDQDAVEITVMDKRWQLVLDCLGAEPPPFSRGTRFHFRLRLIAHTLDKTLLERTVALAEQSGGFGARQLRAALDSPPLFGAGRVEDTFNLLGHALRKAVGLAAKALGTSAEVLMADAGLELVGQSSLKAALDLDWGAPTARAHALRLVLEEVERWKSWLEQQQRLSAQEPPMQEVLETIGQLLGKAIWRQRHGLNDGALISTDSAEIKTYFESEFGGLGTDRQSAGIVSTWTGMAEPFLSGPIRDILCTSTNFIPEFSRRGAVIILNFPLDEWEEIGRTAQLAFKYIWQRAVLRRQNLPPGEVPVFLWADEAQNFVTSADMAFQTESRSSVCCTVFLTQNINNYVAAFHENAEAHANALLAGLALKVFHRQGDHRTNEWAAQTIAQGRVVYYSGGSSESRGLSQSDNWGYNRNWSSGPGGGGTNSGSSSGTSRQLSTNEGWSQQRGFQVEPEVFTRLKSGGPQHKNQVEAILFKSGASFEPTGRPFTGVTFRQR